MENAHLLGSNLLGIMEVFISVVDSGSFSESARRLGLSQPSVSRQVSALEEHLGVRLLQRTTRRLSLTEAGQIYYEKARQIQLDVVEAGLSIGGFKEKPSGILKVSAPYTWTENIIAPHISEFLSLYPELKLDIECNDQFQDMIEDRLDIVIRVGVLKDSSYIAVPLGNVRMLMCATPAYLEKFGTPKTAKDLQNHNFILFEEFNQISFDDGLNTEHVTITGNVIANSVPVMLAAVLQDMGITILPDLLINHLIERDDIRCVMPDVEIDIKSLPINKVFALYSNRKHLPAKVRVFIDFFKTKIGN